MKQAFSLLEVIFVIAVLALLASFALKNGYGFLDKANLTKIKAEVALIRSALNSNKNKRIQQGQTDYPLLLDMAKVNTEGEWLFAGMQDEKLLLHPLRATTTTQKEIGQFAKISSSHYYAYLEKERFVEFIYNKNDGTFSCNYDNTLCKEFD